MTETWPKAQCINESNILSLYLYAMKSPVTRQKYQKSLEKFFGYLEIDGKTIEERVLHMSIVQKDTMLDGHSIRY